MPSILPLENRSEIMRVGRRRSSARDDFSWTNSKHLIIIPYSLFLIPYSYNVSFASLACDIFLRHDRHAPISRCHGYSFAVTVPKFRRTHGRNVCAHGIRSFGRPDANLPDALSYQSPALRRHRGLSYGFSVTRGRQFPHRMVIVSRCPSHSSTLSWSG
jgi:hypothetical protein